MRGHGRARLASGPMTSSSSSTAPSRRPTSFRCTGAVEDRGELQDHQVRAGHPPHVCAHAPQHGGTPADLLRLIAAATDP